MAIVQAVSTGAPWRACLTLRYERDHARTALARRVHHGPLVVQKSLYPEGDGVCQNIIVHPPGGVVGGDTLAIGIDVEAHAHAQLTTPGAAKWYRSAGRAARQAITLRVAKGAVLEWLLQEAIVFDAAIAELDTTVALVDDAVYLGWDVVCLGRTAAGERFARGQLRQRLSLHRNGVPIFAERAVLAGGAPLLESPVGLNGCAVFGTFVAAATEVSGAALAQCRGLAPTEGDGAVTRVHDCLVARYRGASAEAARSFFGTVVRATSGIDRTQRRAAAHLEHMSKSPLRSN